jgi:hypothetical protein
MSSFTTGESNAGVTHSQAQSINVLPKLDSTLALFLKKMYFLFLPNFATINLFKTSVLLILR